jgi:hypothetical protein
MPRDDAEDKKLTADDLILLSSMVGVTLTAERAEALAPQAEQHFAWMRSLDAIHVGSVEPMLEFRLDRQTSKP